MFAEVNLSYLVIVHNFLRAAACKHFASVNNPRMVTDAEGFAHIVVGNQHTNTARLEKADDLLDVDHRNRVDTGKRLIQQDQFGLRRQRTRDLYAATFATRQRYGGGITQMIDVEFCE